MNQAQIEGQKGERIFAQMCARRGIPCTKAPYNCEWDFEIRGTLVEVKSARLGKDGKWLFNIHRHNKLPKDGCDLYVLRLSGMPRVRRYSLYLLFSAPIKIKTFYIGLRDLLQGNYLNEARAFTDWMETLRRA